jgi:hypothetical protein
MHSKGKYSAEFMAQFKTRANGEVGITKSCIADAAVFGP